MVSVAGILPLLKHPSEFTHYFCLLSGEAKLFKQGTLSPALGLSVHASFPVVLLTTLSSE